MDLLRDLYGLSQENRDFINARIANDTSVSIKPYLETVETALYPDVHGDGRVQLRDARSAIAAYRRASNDEKGTLELMLRFVECGTEFTADFGDVDERFYSSLERMFQDVVKLVESLPSADHAPYAARLIRIVERAGEVGWGYHDHISAVFHESEIDDPRPDV